ncbi:hypothetical protein [Bacillus sp. PPSBB_11]|uniref:hypothetical protein n=1 Tax=Bacillus sp. PPSBB_11 TaxID=3125777 RepID=UPI0030FABC92
MAALKGVKTLDMVGGEITKVAYEGAEYERVEGDAKVGDIIRLTKEARYDVTPGGFYTVRGVRGAIVRITDDVNEPHQWPEEYYDLFRKKHVRLKVGDYAKVVGDTFHSDIVGGAIVKITDLSGEDGYLRFEHSGDDDYDYAKPSSLEKVSAEEAKWAKIGRKVDEYKVGDLVKYLSDGEICEVGKITDRKVMCSTEEYGLCGELPKDITLITPVEARFDRS